MSTKTREERRAARAAEKEERGAGRTEGPDARDGEGVRGADGEAGAAAAAEGAADPGPVEDRVPDVEPTGLIDTIEFGDGDGEPVHMAFTEDELVFKSDEDLSDLPEALQMAIVAFDLKRADVLDHRLTEDGVVIVTRGGRKLRWPGDEAKAAALTPEEKDGIPRRDFPPANLFGKKG